MISILLTSLLRKMAKIAMTEDAYRKDVNDVLVYVIETGVAIRDCAPEPDFYELSIVKILGPGAVEDLLRETTVMSKAVLQELTLAQINNPYLVSYNPTNMFIANKEDYL